MTRARMARSDSRHRGAGYNWLSLIESVLPLPSVILHKLRFLGVPAILPALTATTALAPLHDRRVVDTVVVGDAESELSHGFHGTDAMVGFTHGATFRETTGNFSYGVAAYFDSEVTVALTLLRIPGGARTFALVVEDSVIATPVAEASVAGDTSIVNIEVLVPIKLTVGKSNLVVAVNAVNGTTPALRGLRIIQDHFELQDPE